MVIASILGSLIEKSCQIHWLCKKEKVKMEQVFSGQNLFFCRRWCFTSPGERLLSSWWSALLNPNTVDCLDNIYRSQTLVARAGCQAFRPKISFEFIISESTTKGPLNFNAQKWDINSVTLIYAWLCCLQTDTRSCASVHRLASLLLQRKRHLPSHISLTEMSWLRNGKPHRPRSISYQSKDLKICFRPRG